MLFKLTSDTQQRGKQLCVNIHLPRVLGSVALSVCTIQDTPLFLCHTHCVLEALKDKVTVLGAIAMPAQCSQSQLQPASRSVHPSDARYRNAPSRRTLRVRALRSSACRSSPGYRAVESPLVSSIGMVGPARTLFTKEPCVARRFMNSLFVSRVGFTLRPSARSTGFRAL